MEDEVFSVKSAESAMDLTEVCVVPPAGDYGLHLSGILSSK